MDILHYVFSCAPRKIVNLTGLKWLKTWGWDPFWVNEPFQSVVYVCSYLMIDFWEEEQEAFSSDDEKSPASGTDVGKTLRQTINKS